MAVKTINIAVAGAGFMGMTHLRAYLQIPGVRILALCCPNRPVTNGVLRGVAGNIQQTPDLRLPAGVKIVRHFEDLLAEKGVDAVDICTPTALHPAQVMAALQAGRRVLCEKPLAETAAQARKVLKVAANASGFLMPAMCIRFWPGWNGLKQVVEEKKHGKILAATFRRVSPRPAWGDSGSHPGGALLDLHIHDTDFVHFLFGRPDKVFSTGVTARNGEVEHVVTQYCYRHGPVVAAEGSWLQAAGFNMTFTIQCERATLDFDFQRGPNALRVTLAGKEARTIKLRGTDGYHGEIRHFIHCIRRGEPSKIVTAEDALAVLEICEAEEKSVRTGAAVKL
jgi:predicted dehydrogenase